jgi:class 3 adenylate cyclase
MSAILNSYLDAMAKIALKWGGTIDKFVGDAVMVFFGDPEFVSDKAHATRAVGMALDMMKELERLRAKWVSEGFERPLHVRAGIATGYCTVGNFGSENKMDYTIIGPPVNLAARLEASAAPDTIFIAHETYSLVRDAYACERLGTIGLKGFSKPVEAFRVLGPRDAVAKPVENEYATIEGSHLTIKHRTVEPKVLTDAERASLEDTLLTALGYVRGDISFEFDQESGAWRRKERKGAE